MRILYALLAALAAALSAPFRMLGFGGPPNPAAVMAAAALADRDGDDEAPIDDGRTLRVSDPWGSAVALTPAA